MVGLGSLARKIFGSANDRRIKGYASLWTRKRQATLSWVWEVFDSNGERVLRVAGDEKDGTEGRDAWRSSFSICCSRRRCACMVRLGSLKT